MENLKQNSRYFLGLDIRSVSLGRIALGIALILDLLIYRIPYLDFFYYKDAVISKKVIENVNEITECSFLYYLNSKEAVTCVFILIFLIYTLFTLGYKTRWTSILAYICFSAVLERSSHLGGSQAILRVALFWSIFLPLGALFTPFGKTPSAGKEVRNIGAFALLLQISLIYVFTSLAKTGTTWKHGTALSYALMIVYTKGPFANNLLAYPDLCRYLTFCIRYIGIAIPLLIFFPRFKQITRIMAAITIFIFHWSMLPFLNIDHFCLATLPFIVFLLPSAFWERTGFLKKYYSPVFYDLKSGREIINKSSRGFSRIKTAVIGVLLAYIITANISLLDPGVWKVVDKINDRSCNCMGLMQNWPFFSPDPLNISGKIYFFGMAPGNQVIDLETEEPYDPVKIEAQLHRPDIIPEVFISMHYFADKLDYGSAVGKQFAEGWIKYEMKKWKKKHPDINFLSVTMLSATVKSVSPGVTSKANIRFLYQKDYYNPATSH